MVLYVSIYGNVAKVIKEQKSQSIDLNERDVVEILALWFGDPKKDVLTAEEWIASIQRAKDQFEWDDDVTMNNVVEVLFGDALLWFLDLVTFLFTRYHYF